ncbi:MAG: serine hydrolase domain-containing protein, partial [Bacteroidota bacterium]
MKIKLAFVISIIAFTACNQKNAALQTTQESKKKALQLDTLFSQLYEMAAFNGNVLVAEQGKIIFQKSYGLANEELKEALNNETVFELASVSKQFTAMGIVQLCKNGQLAYDDLITKYIPELKNYENITIRHLLTHTSGIPDYIDLAQDNWNKTKIATNDDMIDLIENLNPNIRFTSNEEWEYSNTGYLLLASIIERVSGLSFEAYLAAKIFGPLQMENTFIYRRRFAFKEVDNYAIGYFYSDSLKRKITPDELAPNRFIYLDGIVGDGMVNSNALDLLKWDRALYNNSIINDEDRKVIFSSHKANDNLETNYGFGWMIDSTTTYGKIVYHSGGWAGYIAYIERHLDNDKTVIILQNNATS